MTDPQLSERRAGFWRRLAALIIDTVIVGVPFQILVVLLYTVSNGAVQTTSGGIVFNNCLKTLQISELPSGLNPSPPAQSNFAVICRTSFLGLETAQRLIVGRTTKEGSVTKTISQTYMLGADGTPRNGISLDGIVFLALLIYLVTLEHRLGATLGKRLLGIRAADIANAGRTGLPLRKALLRNFYMWVGVLPMLVVLLIFWIAGGGVADTTFGGSFFTWFGIAALCAVIWDVLIFVQIVRKKDPIYDRLAGTAVVLRPQ